jgi:probable phosphoglycerate mutase
MSKSLPSVYLVRHGETEWSRSRRHTGHTDIPLTEHGERQARALNSQLREVPFVVVLTSPLIRARQTAELAGFASQAQTEPGLMEWDYGEYEGRRTDEIRAERPGWQPFTDGYPGGEMLEDISLRADRVIARVRAANSNALLFAHRDIIRVLIARWIELPAGEGRRFYLETGSMSVLSYDHGPDEPILQRLNLLDLVDLDDAKE